MRVNSPSPYMFFLKFGDLKLAGASPETLVKLINGKVLIRPIAGTRGRSADPIRDKALEKSSWNRKRDALPSTSCWLTWREMTPVVFADMVL